MRPYPKVKDKIKIEFNPITGEFDLISEFNPDRIVTHKLSPFANQVEFFDQAQGVYFDAGDQIVTDSNGNVVVI